MKFRSVEQQGLAVIAVVIGLYDFFSIPFNSFLITSVFALALFYLTESLFFVAFCFLVPQFIRVLNFVMNRKEKFTEVSRMKNHKESFSNPNEIHERLEKIKQKPSAVSEVSGIVDISQPSSEMTIQGNPSLPKFMEQFQNGTSLNANTQIYTTSESSIPQPGSVDRNPRNSVHVENYDDLSINTALTNSMNKNVTIQASNLRSVEMNPSA
jgi:hypothetical protein